MNKYLEFGMGLGTALLKGATVAAIGVGASHLTGAAYSAAGRAGLVTNPVSGGVSLSQGLVATGDYVSFAAGGYTAAADITRSVIGIVPEVAADLKGLSGASTAKVMQAYRALRDRLPSKAPAAVAPAAAVAPEAADISREEAERLASAMIVEGLVLNGTPKAEAEAIVKAMAGGQTA